MGDGESDDSTAGPALEAVLSAQQRGRRPEGRPQGDAGSATRVQFTAFICGSAWLAVMLVPLRFGDGLTALYAARMTLVIGAVAIPMLLVEDRTLWRSHRSRLMNAFGTETAWVIAGFLYLLIFFALFRLMDLFW